MGARRSAPLSDERGGVYSMKRIKPKRELTRLELAAFRFLCNADDEPNYGPSGRFRDLQRGGCLSGMAPELVYYADTVKFFKRHRAEISAMLTEALADTGPPNSCAGLFGDEWDATDPLANESPNQNLLAWFGFEEACRVVANLQGWDE
jgi:hypothetical protein